MKTNDTNLVQAFLKKWWVESDFNLVICSQESRIKTDSSHRVNAVIINQYNITIAYVTLLVSL